MSQFAEAEMPYWAIPTFTELSTPSSGQSSSFDWGPLQQFEQTALDHAYTNYQQHGPSYHFADAILNDAICCDAPSPPCDDPHCTSGIPCQSTSECSSHGCADIPCIDEGCDEEDIIPCEDGLQCLQHDIPFNTCYNGDCGEPPCEESHPFNGWYPQFPLVGPPPMTAAMQLTCHKPDHRSDCTCVDPRHTINQWEDISSFSTTTFQQQQGQGHPLPAAPGFQQQQPPNQAFHAGQGFRYDQTIFQRQPYDLTDGSTPTSCSEVESAGNDVHSAQSALNAPSQWLSPQAKQGDEFRCLWHTHHWGRDSVRYICGVLFESEKELSAHIEKDHINQEGRDQMADGFVCNWKDCQRQRAGKCFTSRPKLKRHALTHAQYCPHACEHDGCPVKMKTRDAIVKHQRIHFGIKPYQCDWKDCSKSFTTSSERTIHYVMHTGEKPHVCDLEGCNRRFADSSNLSKHKRTHEIGMYRCLEPECGMRMKRIDQIRRHWSTSGHMSNVAENTELEEDYRYNMEVKFDALSAEEKKLPPKSPKKYRKLKLKSDIGGSGGISKRRGRKPKSSM